MEKKLEYLKWKPRWVSHLGCIKGCLDYLDMEVSDAWLFGATGHAFIINMHEVVCPSGPTAWMTEMLFKLGRNIGYEIDGVFSNKNKPDFEEVRKKAWGHAKNAIDQGIPCYGWELYIPEYYVINSYNDTGYFYSGPIPAFSKTPKPWPKPWQELGASDIGVIEVYSVRPCKPADENNTVKQAFEFALEHAKSPEKWTFPKYKAGLDGFDLWIKALNTNTANGFGMTYNAEVWYECRHFAVEFLKEAKQRLDSKLGPLFDEAIKQYDIVARNLKKVEELFPFVTQKPGHIKDENRRRKAVDCLKVARTAEESGLKVLERIVKAL